MTTETPASAETGATSLADILNPAPAGKETSGEAAPHEDPGAAAAQAATGADPSAQPAPKAETQPAPAGNAGEGERRDPRWYREDLQRRERERRALLEENERLRSGQQPAQRQQPRGDVPEFPDPLEDPQGHWSAVQGLVHSATLETRLYFSEGLARQKHGDDLFDEAYAWLDTKRDLQPVFMRQRDPWAAAIAHYQREKIAEEIGDDPNAWRERERERIRAEERERLEAENGQRPSGMTAHQQQQHRAAPPAPASTARSASVGRDASGRFTPTPLGELLGKR